MKGNMATPKENNNSPEIDPNLMKIYETPKMYLK
jgi:hypothetical protein